MGVMLTFGLRSINWIWSRSFERTCDGLEKKKEQQGLCEAHTSTGCSMHISSSMVNSFPAKATHVAVTGRLRH